MKFLILTLIIAIAAAAAQELAQEEIEEQWKQYKETYGNGFSNFNDETFRKSLFVKELQRIEEHNQKFKKGLVTYEMGLNQFTIYTEEEMNKYTQGVKDIPFEQISELPMRKISSENFANLPETLDWRQKGVINPIVKDQGDCSSCWIFAAISGLESAYAIQRKVNVSLSEQQLVDCLKGCNAGWMGDALTYIAKNGGVNYDRDYPYTAIEQQCRYNVRKPHVTVTGEWGHTRLPRGNEEALKEAVANVGPIVVAIEVGNEFQSYKSGVFYSSACTDKVNHAVTVIGYGRENGLDYWLVRNSWGPGWGDHGYIKMARNKNNNCAIANWALYPTI